MNTFAPLFLVPGNRSFRLSKRRPRNAHGFTLVAVLLLVALVTILVSTTCILSQIERQASGNSVKTEKARQNALFALNAALSQLQKTAGPDQRITARAEILDAGTTVNQPYWTGVWTTGTLPLDTGSAGQQTQRQISFGNATPTAAGKAASATWLVSTPPDPNNPTTLQSLSPITGVATGSTAITVAKNLGTSRTSVIVPLVPMITVSPAGAITGTSGHYAYWVSDEGVKAKVNLKDPTFNIEAKASNFVQTQLHFLAPQAVPINSGSGGLLGPDNMTDVRGQSDLSKVTTLQSMGLVTKTNNPNNSLLSGSASAYSTDATTYSYGVLADVCNGGLKTDLSLAFEDSGQYTSFLSSLDSKQSSTAAPGDARVYTLNGLVSSGANNFTSAIIGPRWQSLYNYYSLYKDLIPKSAMTSTPCPFTGLGGDPGSNSPSMAMRAYAYSSKFSGTSAAVATTGECYMPQFAALAIYFSIKANQVGTSGTYNFGLYMEPRFVLYNPYNVTLTQPATNKYTIDLSATSFENPTWTIKIVGATSGTHTLNDYITSYGSNDQHYYDVQTDTSSTMTFGPGELRVFGLAKGSPISAPTAGYQPLWNTPNKTTLSDSGLGDGNNVWAGNSTYSYVSGTDGSQWQVPGSPNDQVTITFRSYFKGNNSVYNLPSALRWPCATGAASLSLGAFGSNIVLAPTTSGTFQTTLGALVSSTATYIGHVVFRAKGLNQANTNSQTPCPQMPVFAGCDGYINALTNCFSILSTDGVFHTATTAPQNDPTELIPVWNNNTQSFGTHWGTLDVGSNTTAGSSPDPMALILKDIPRQPLVSLGQFMHMSTRNSCSLNTPPSLLINDGGENSSSMMSVGGSLCDPLIPLAMTTGSFTNNYGGTFEQDDNFLSNQALFDTYFFSTVPPITPDANYQKVFPWLMSGTAAFNSGNIASNTCVLPNSRMSFYFKNGAPPATGTASGAIQNYQSSAANLLLNGAFNINSTSIAAWSALLSSLSGNSVTYLNNGSSSPQTLAPTQLQNPIFRFLSLVTADPSCPDSAPINTLWGGVHSLTNDQVTSLATKIVQQVKLRGPFLSMADFLNRRLDSNPATGFGYMGALQAAIDSTTINHTISLSGTACGTVPTNQLEFVPNPTSSASNYYPSNTAYGIPGWLMQQDIVQCFSPVMTARSDTFVIRCYGEYDNPKTGANEGQTWGEAVVQRIPDFVDQSDPNLSAASGGLGDATPISKVDVTNKTLGRRFKIVSFRWLNETDL